MSATITTYSDLAEAKGLEGYRLYGIEFSDGTIKVGRSVSARKRLEQHAHAGRAFGITIAAYWVSDETADILPNESALIELVNREAESRRRNEYFTGITLARTAEIAIEVFTGDYAVTPKAHKPRKTAGSVTVATGIRIGEAIKASGLSVDEVAAKSGLSVSSIIRKVKGERPITFQQIADIARALGVPVGSLIDFGGVAAA